MTTAGGTSATSGADQFTYQAANLDTWTGLGATNNWSDAGNWSKDAAPGSGDTVVFDGHSGKNATVDSAFAGTVAAVQINSGYSGTVSLNQSLTVTGAFTEQAGTYNANGYATTVSGLHDPQWRHLPGLDDHADLDGRPDRLGRHVHGFDRHGHGGQRQRFRPGP